MHQLVPKQVQIQINGDLDSLIEEYGFNSRLVELNDEYKKVKSKMNELIINSTDFEISPESNITYKSQNDQTFVNIEIYGNIEKYNLLTKDEEADWSWTLYPPHFYFRNVPVTDKNNFDIELTNNLLDEYDIALYLMEHCDVFGKLSYKNGMLTIKGKVDLYGENNKFTVSFSNT